MAENLLSFGPAQKEVYFGKVNEQLNSDDTIFGWIPKEPADGGGVATAAQASANSSRGLRFAVHLGRNAVATFMDPEGNFPSAGAQVYKQGYINGKTIYLPTSVSVGAIERTRTDPAAFAPIMIDAATRAGNDLRNECERAIMGDGSGVLGVQSGTISFAANIGTLTLDNYQDAVKWQVGMYVQSWSARTYGATQRQIISTGAGLPQYAVVVQSVNLSTASPPVFTVTLAAVDGGTWSAAAANAAGDVWVRANPVASNTTTVGIACEAARTQNQRREPMGIDGICLDCDSPMETGTTALGFEGINAVNGYGTGVAGASGSANGVTGQLGWQAYVNRATTGRAFNPSIIQSLQDRPTRDYSDQPNLYVTSFGGRWEYANSLFGIRRTVNTIEMSGNTGGGFRENIKQKKFTEYGDVAVVPSRFCRTDLISAQLCTNLYALNMNRLRIKEWYKPRFMDVDGLQWRMIGRTPFFESILEYTFELHTEARIAHARAAAILAADFA